eukprot:PITA_18761
MVDEYDSIFKNSAWGLVPRLVDKSVVGSRWLYKEKHAIDGSIEKHKEIFVAKGFSQVEGIDYEDTFAPVARLKWVLYGLKQAPCAWYTRIDSYLTSLGFTKSEADANLYHIVVEGKLLIILLYVDDLILTSDEHLIISCKEDLSNKFEMKEMGPVHYFLRLELWHGDGELFVS